MRRNIQLILRSIVCSLNFAKSEHPSWFTKTTILIRGERNDIPVSSDKLLVFFVVKMLECVINEKKERYENNSTDQNEEK